MQGAVLRRPHGVRRISMLVAVAVALAAPALARATTFTVNSGLDAVDAAPGNGVCATSSGTCTLRAAIQEANALPGADSIGVSLLGAVTLTRLGKFEDAGALGDLDITSDLTIDAPGLALRGTTGWDDRLLDVHGATVTLNGLTITGGRSDGGGAIRNDGTLTVNGGTLASNSVTGPGGGAILNLGTLTLSNVTLSGNSTDGDGGAIRNEGSVSIAGSALSNNSAGGQGGALWNDVLTGATIAGSTLSGNTSGSDGGAISSDGFVTLSGSTLTGNSSAPAGNGGAIRSGGQLAVDSSTISGNSGGFEGGGIEIEPPGPFAASTISDSTVDTNTADLGAGIWNGGKLVVTDSTVRANVADSGGGIGSNNDLTLSGVTISGNAASGASGSGTGGGVWNISSAKATNTTVSENTATGKGGGIRNDGSLTANNATITRNFGGLASGATAAGGGVSNASGASFQFANTIVAGNHDNSASSARPDCSGSLASLGYNLIGTTAGCVVFGTVTGNMTGLDALLGPLADNGGPTFTHSLATCAVKLCLSNFTLSPAVDRGSPATTGANACAATDQRGFARPLDGNGDGVARCDIGAFEWNPPRFLLGTFSFAPEDAAVAVHDHLRLSFGWTVPGPSWRALDTLELRIRDDARTILWLRFHEVAGAPGTFALVDPTSGREGPAFAPGRPNRLETSAATVYLAGTTVDGPPGSHVALTLDTGFKPQAVGEYEVEVRGTGDDGQVQGWLPAGRLAVAR